MTKYHNQKVHADGKVFDSRKEYVRYQDLSLLEKAGKIHDLQCQVKYQLIPAQYEIISDPKTGKAKRVCVERAISYIADFVYKDKDGNMIVEDVKGYRDKRGGAYAKYIMKRKLMLWFHGIKIKEV